MNKAYSRINGGKGWENSPSIETPLNKQNLDKVDIGLDEVDNRVITLDTTKATKTEVAPLIKEIEFNESNGIFAITRKNGSKFTIDTKIEKIAINFGYDPVTQRISLTLIDGTIQYIDLSALITQYEFMDTDTVSFFVDEGGKISAIVKEGSIQEKHLRPNYLAEIKVESAKAQLSEANAAQSAVDAENSKTLAESYTHGGTGIREGEDDDNAKKYKELAEQAYENLQKGVVTGAKGEAETNFRQGNVNITPENIGLGNVPNVTTNDQTPTFTQAVARENIASGNKLSVIFGKIMKWFADLKTVAFSGSYNDLSNKPSIGAATITIKQNGAVKGTFTVNQNENTTIELTDNNTVYSLPLAASGTRGGVKIGYSANGKNYPVQLSNEQAFVSVPWTDNNTWKANTAASEGYVAKGSGQANKVWKTDANGNPGWRPDADTLPWGGGTFTGNISMGTNAIRFYDGKINSPAGQQLYIAASDEWQFELFLGVKTLMWTFCPGSDGGVRLGHPNYRWGQIYSSVSTISTSDRNKKKDINLISDKYLEFFALLRPVTYRFIDGASGRTHVGFISQDIEDAMVQAGLSDLDFAGFCKDKALDADGNPILDGHGNSTYIYSLRYEEFIAINTAVLQRHQQKINKLMERMEKLEQMINTSI